MAPDAGSQNIFQGSEVHTIVYPENNKSNILSYKGEIVNGKPSGKGTVIWKNGSKYVGNWENGLRNGYGVQTFPSDSKTEKYEGHWIENNFCGQGTLVFKNRSCYVGQFKADQFHGDGTFTFATGAGSIGQNMIDQKQ